MGNKKWLYKHSFELETAASIQFTSRNFLFKIAAIARRCFYHHKILLCADSKLQTIFMNSQFAKKQNRKFNSLQRSMKHALESIEKTLMCFTVLKIKENWWEVKEVVLFVRFIIEFSLFIRFLFDKFHEVFFENKKMIMSVK